MADLPVPTLETTRFVLRKLERSDATALFPTLSDEEQSRYLSQGPFGSLPELEHWLLDPEWEGRSWSAVDRGNGAVVARLVAIPDGKRTSEIGYITVQDRQGQGIASECATRPIAYLFAEEDHHRLTAETDPRNAGSNAVLERIGFRCEGWMIECTQSHLGWCDEFRWGLLAREWRAGR